MLAKEVEENEKSGKEERPKEHAIRSPKALRLPWKTKEKGMKMNNIIQSLI